jgi:hypothetical protein
MCTIQMLMELAETQDTLPIVNKAALDTDTDTAVECGRFGAVSCALKEKASFLDYLAGGLELNFVVAVDYTASNGDPSDPTSLHFVPKTGRIINPYISAIRSVASVLEFYDFDREFPCYGFGAKLTKSGIVDHCFPLSGSDSASVKGAEGIIAAYREKTTKVHFSGPTVFSNVVYRAASLAKSLQQTPNQKYVVLMIITDGTINDMDNCIDAIVTASTQPMSVIIVGVGDEDFAGMVKLDSDNKMLKSRTGKVAERDIVQFTSIQDMQKVADQAKAGGTTLDVHDLVSRDLLAEIPAQVTEYFVQHDMPPMSKRSGNAFSQEGGKSRAAEVQAARDQIVEAKAHNGVINAPLPQQRREEDYRREMNQAQADPAVQQVQVQYEQPLQQQQQHQQYQEQEQEQYQEQQAYSDPQQAEWYDATEQARAQAPDGADFLPTYSTVLLDGSSSNAPQPAPELLPSYSAVLDSDGAALPPAAPGSYNQPPADAAPAGDAEDEWFEADEDD